MVTAPILNSLTDRIRGMVSRFQRSQQPKRWIGLDLGSRSMKLIELELTAAGPRLIKSLIQELPVVQNGQPVDLVGWLQSALKEFNGADVHVAVSGAELAIRRLHMPLMSKHELPEAVKWQVKDQVPFPIHDAVLSFHVIGEVWDKDIKKQDVLAAAAAKPFLHELIATVERAGGHVASLIPTPAALWRCVSTLVPDAARGSVAVIELGASKTEVTIAKDGHVRLVRDLAIGSESMTEALVGVVTSERGEIAIDHSKAEAIKRRYGVLTESEEGTTEEGIPFFHLSSLMRPVLENVLTEVSRVFDFYKVQMEEAGVSRVLLCGGGAALKRLQPFLAEGLGLTVEIFNPLIRITDRVQPLEPEQIAEGGPRLAVSIGAALDHGQGLNLLPQEVQRSRVLTVSRRAWVRAAKAVAAAALALYVGLQVVAGTLQWQVHHRQQAWAKLEGSYRHAMDLTATSKTLESSLDQTHRFLDQQPVWEGVLKELGELMPPGIELDELTVAAEASGSQALAFHLKGRAAARHGAGEGGISEFIEALERSVFFRNVELVTSEMRVSGTGSANFEIAGFLE